MGGVGKGGLLEGEPRSVEAAWNTYRKWIESGAMEAAVKPGVKSYVIEWAISFDPCLEVEPGKFYNTAMGNKPMGLNIALGDLDEAEHRVRGSGRKGKRGGEFRQLPPRRLVCGRQKHADATA